ncbi:MAG: SDR family oxidoreductase [Planctomycetota bacterium]|jgi:3-oxoacyl-[acyl-carrier protein] reductase
MALEGKVALVTGASRGIGESIALALAKAGADVALAARNRGALEGVAAGVRALGRKAHVFVADLADADVCADAVNDAVEHLGRLDIVVNNAAAITMGSVEELSVEQFDAVMRINVRAPWCVCKAAVPHLRRAGGGTIVNIGSTAGKRAGAGYAAYITSKFALSGFTEALFREVRSDNIRVCLVSPSSVDTTSDGTRTAGKGALLHRNDVAAAVLHAVTLPRRAMVRDIELWGTNP